MNLWRFASTRVLTGVLGLLWVLLLARWMSVPSYAAFSVLMATVFVSSIVGNLGVDRVLYRELPLAHIAGDRVGAKRLIRLAITGRIVIAPFAAGVLMAMVQSTRPQSMSLTSGFFFGVLLASSLVISDVLSLSANALGRFEHQARIVVCALALRLAAGAALHHFHGEIDVGTALTIVLAGDLLQSIASWLLAVRPGLPKGDARVPARPTLKKLGHSSVTNYASYLLSIPWQGATAVLLVGTFGNVGHVALFSLLQTMVDRLRLYLPLQLLQNAFEPMLIRRYALKQDHEEVNVTLDLLRRANTLILMGAASLLIACGSTLVLWVTAGKYVNAGMLAAVLVACLALRGVTGVMFIAANVFDEMPALTRVYGLCTLVLAGPLVWSAVTFGAYGVMLISVLPGFLLWALMAKQRRLSAAGVWRLGPEIACLVAALAGGGAGVIVTGFLGDGETWLLVVVPGVTALSVYFGLTVLLKVFRGRDLLVLRDGLRPSYP